MARKTLPLSDLRCRSAKPRERDYKLFDGDGLFLLVKANGTKSWRFRYTKPTDREGLTAFVFFPVSFPSGRSNPGVPPPTLDDSFLIQDREHTPPLLNRPSSTKPFRKLYEQPSAGW